MVISYTDARKIIDSIADKVINFNVRRTEIVRIGQALGRISAEDCLSSVSTPAFDTSAMDGFAVSSIQTTNASEISPVLMSVNGTMAAGQIPLIIETEEVELSCVEIMTGSQFPKSKYKQFDAVIPVEHVMRISTQPHIVSINKPAKRNQHRRFAGSDFQKGDVVCPKGMIIGSRHIMALASTGMGEIAVARRIRVGVWSTGTEIANRMVPDVNGPYLVAALQEVGVDATFLGVILDGVNCFVEAMGKELDSFDLLLSTGAVSMGKFDFVRSGLDLLKAEIHFHHVAMRPGHPVLFASVSGKPYFGLPGNPIATAVCFQFLVVPYISRVAGISDTGSLSARIQYSGAPPLTNPSHLDVFRHGNLRRVADSFEVELNQDQSPAKVAPLAGSNCWVHIPEGSSVLEAGDIVECFPMKIRAASDFL